ncbi:MAG TPA: hypothetical protein DCP91_12325 [Eggerthellaceae bacterium]|nr:hypothetical protein [Eggerthellaceae bacterium]
MRAIMERLGFTTELYGKCEQDVYHKEPVSNFEMHRALFGPNVDGRVRGYWRDVGGRLLGDGCGKRLGPEDFYLYLCAHGHKHYTISGTGLRSLLDVYVYLSKVDLDMGYVAAEARKMGIAGFEEASRSLAVRLFSGRELAAADREMLGYFMSSGAYGTLGQQVQNAMAKSGGGRLRYALGRFLVPVSEGDERYEAFAARYPLFYEHRALLPLLPIYRAARSMKSGRFMAEARAIRDAREPGSVLPPGRMRGA